MAAHASHGKYFVLRPNADPLGNVSKGPLRTVCEDRSKPLIYLND